MKVKYKIILLVIFACSLSIKQSFAQDSFIDVPGVTGADLNDLQVDSDGNMYVVNRIDSKIYSSADNGANWAIMTSANNAYAVMADGTDLYYSDYERMFKSTDQGVTWQVITTGTMFKNPTRILKLPNDANTFVIQSGCEGVYVSSDAGVNWTRISKNTQCVDGNFRLNFTSTGNIYFPERDLGIVRHTFPVDGIWSSNKSEIVFPKDNVDLSSDYGLSVGVNANDKIYITYTEDATYNTIVTASVTGDNGTFSPIVTPQNGINDPFWSLSPSGLLYLVTQYPSRVWQLTNEITPAWTEKVTPGLEYLGQYTSFFYWKNNVEVYAGAYPGLVYSFDESTNWTIKNGTSPNAFETTAQSDIEITANNNIIVHGRYQNYKGFWLSTDQGASFNWSPQNFNTNINGFAGTGLVKLQDNSLAFVNGNGVSTSNDGINWTLEPAQGATKITTSGNEILMLRNTNPAGLGKSSDKGATWTNTPITGGFPVNFNVEQLFTSNNYVFTYLYNYNTGFNEWWRINISTFVATILVTPLENTSNACTLNGKIYLSNGQKVAISADAGSTWTTFDYNHQYLVPIRQGTGGIGLSSNGSFAVTQDDGISFRTIALNSITAVITDLVQDTNGTFYGSCERGPVVKFTGKLILSGSELPPTFNLAWEQKAGPYGGTARQLLIGSANQLYVANTEMLYKQNEGTNSWDRLSIPNHHCCSYAMTIDNADNIYFNGSGATHISTDGGTTWSISYTDYVQKIRKANNGNLIIARSYDLSISTDNGVSYQTPVGISSGNFDDLEIDSNGNLWASGRTDYTTSVIYNSIDNGLNWTIVSGIDLSANQDVFSINKLEDGAIAIVTSDDIYKSTDNGATWISIKGNLTSTYNNDPYWARNSKLYISPSNEYYFFNSLFLYKSTDNGANWTPLNKRSNNDDRNGYFSINDIKWYNSKMLIATENSGVLESVDDGVTLTTFQENKGFYQSNDHDNLIVVDESVKLFIDYKGRNKIIRTTDDGQSFSTVFNEFYLQGIKKTLDGDLIGYGGRFALSSDKGETWADLNSEFNGWGNFLSVPDVASGSYYAATQNNGWSYWKSDDLIKWTKINDAGLPDNYDLNQMEVDSQGIMYVKLYNYSLNKNMLYKIYPFSGATLVNEINEPQRIIRKNGKMYVLAENKINISTDGISWAQKPVPDGDQFFVSGNGYIFISNGYDGKCWLSINEGKSWQNVGGLLGDTFQGIDIDMTNGFAYAIAENQPLLKSTVGLLQNDNTGPVLSSTLPAHTDSNVPTYFKLELNFNEALKAVNGKKIRLYDITDQSKPLEIFDASEVVFSNGNRTISIKPTIEIGLGVTFFVIVDNDAFTDIFDNPYAGIINSSGWNFTISETPTLEDPVFNFKWEQKNGPFVGSARQLLLNSVNQLYVTNEEMLYEQDDDAGKWNRVSISSHHCCYADMIIDNNDNLYFLDSYQLLKSTDGGLIWSSSYIGDGNKIRKAANGNLIITNYESLRISTDDGATFQMPAGISAGSFDDVEVDSLGNIWASGRSNNTSVIYNSTDNGLNWNIVSGIDLSSSQDVFSINKLEAGAVAIVTSDNIYKTVDNGANWVSIKGNLTATFGDDPYWGKNSKIYLSPTNDYYFYNSLFLYKSTNNGATWSALNESSSNTGLNGYFSINDLKWYNSKMLIASENSGILESVDNGISFTAFQGNNGFYQTYNNDNLVIVEGVKLFTDYQGINKVTRTEDDGQNFSNVLEDTYVQGIKKLLNGDLVAFGEKFQLSSDKGQNWTNLTSNFNGFGRYLSVPGDANGSYYSVTEFNGWQFWKSSDLIDWTEFNVTGLPNGYYLHQLEGDTNGNLYVRIYSYELNQDVVYIISSSGEATLLTNISNPRKITRNNGKIYINGYDEFGAGRMNITTDGITWEQKNAPNGEQIYFTENGYIFITNDYFPAKCWLSANEGDKWQNVGGLLGDDFQGIDIDMANGYAYAIAQNQPLLKSSTILLQDDKTGPVLTSTFPVQGSIIAPIDSTLVLTFNEVLNGVSGKNIYLYDNANPGTALEVFDVNSVTFSNENKTVNITPTDSLNYLTSYFVLMDEGAFTDIFGNASSGITDNTTWNFTTMEIPDKEEPVLSFITSNLAKGSAKSFLLSITDDKSISMNTTKIFYRGISTVSSTAFQSAVMTTVAGGTITATDFTVAADDAWYDGMGLEFYFEGEDIAGNKVRLPDSVGYFYSYIDFKSTQSRPDVKGISFGDTESSYRIISVPHKLADSKIATQFDELGTSDVEKWRMFNYNGTSTYDEFPAQLTSLERGKGYWIILKSSIAIFLENAITPENNRDNFYSINLKAGWNQIGNPYTVPISWEEVRAEKPAIIGVVKTYLDGNFSNGNVLQPYEGGFVFAESAVTVKVRFQGITSGGRIEYVGNDISKENWDLPIKISQGEFGNEIGGIGMRVNAIVGKDQFDDYNPPALNNSVELRVKEGEITNFAKSVVPTQPDYVWEFSTVAEGEELSTLSWDNTKFGDNDMELFLLDLAQQRLIDMRIENDYKFIPSKSKNFKLYYGNDIASEIKPSSNVFGSPFPNPTTDIINFSFTISGDYGKSNVSLNIYNSLGEKVKEVISGEFESGFYYKEMSFNANQLPSGVYFSKWVIENRTGKTITETSKIIIK